jgi:hypothetical protein
MASLLFMLLRNWCGGGGGGRGGGSCSSSISKIILDYYLCDYSE